MMTTEVKKWLRFRHAGTTGFGTLTPAGLSVHEGDMFSIVSTGPSSIAVDPTYDRKVLDESIKKITGNGLKPTDIIQGAEGSDGPSEVRYRANVAFSTVHDMLTQMEKINAAQAEIYKLAEPKPHKFALTFVK